MRNQSNQSIMLFLFFFSDRVPGLVWFGLVWFGLVWFGLAWFGLVWFGLVWFGLVLVTTAGFVAYQQHNIQLDAQPTERRGDYIFQQCAA